MHTKNTILGYDIPILNLTSPYDTNAIKKYAGAENNPNATSNAPIPIIIVNMCLTMCDVTKFMENEYA